MKGMKKAALRADHPKRSEFLAPAAVKLRFMLS